VPLWVLTEKGRSWADGVVEDPRAGLPVLMALSDLVDEKDVPYSEEQIASLVNRPTEVVLKALNYLREQGYVDIHRPSLRAAPRMRLRTLEEEEERIRREIEVRRRYERSEKGKAARRRWEQSERAKAVRRKYWASPKGREAQRRYREKKRLERLGKQP